MRHLGLEPRNNTRIRGENSEFPRPAGSKTGSAQRDSGGALPSLDPDLAAVVDAWPTLGEPIRAAIRALVETSKGER